MQLLFRELKSCYRMAHMPSANEHVVHCLICAAVLTLIVSRRLHRLFAKRKQLQHQSLPFDRWARLLEGLAHELLDLLLRPRHRALLLERVQIYLLTEAPDPNRQRVTLAQRAQNGGPIWA